MVTLEVLAVDILVIKVLGEMEVLPDMLVLMVPMDFRIHLTLCIIIHLVVVVEDHLDTQVVKEDQAEQEDQVDQEDQEDQLDNWQSHMVQVEEEVGLDHMADLERQVL